MPEQLANKAKTLQKELVAFRRYLHEQAETGFDLPKSRAFIREKLQALGLDCIERLGKARGAYYFARI